MKWILIFLPLLWSAQAASLAAAEGDCAGCENYLVSDTGVGNNINTISQVTRALAGSVAFSERDQAILCYEFLRNGFKSLKAKFESHGTTIEDGYKSVKCEDGREDLVKYRLMNTMGRSDIAAFILYYKRDLNREHELAGIFNTVVPGPKVPKGTLLDFIDFYLGRSDLDAFGKSEYEKIVVMLRRYGAKKESEL